MAEDRSSPLVVRASAQQPPSAPLTYPEPRPPGPASRHRTCSFACRAPIGYSAGHSASLEEPSSPLASWKPGRLERGGPGAACRPPGGPGQVEGAPARCVRSQEEAKGVGRMRTEQVFLSLVALWTDTLCGLIAPGITLLLLLYERNSVSQFYNLRLQEGAGKTEAWVRLQTQ